MPKIAVVIPTYNESTNIAAMIEAIMSLGDEYHNIIVDAGSPDGTGEIADNVAVKVPLTWDGLKACRSLSQDGTQVNVTLCFSANQALLAAKAGASFISPFVGRLDDIGHDGMQLIAEILEIYGNYDSIQTEVLVASIRSPMHVLHAARLGADVCTIPPNVIQQLAKHTLTDKGLEAFLADWQKTGQSILDRKG